MVTDEHKEIKAVESTMVKIMDQLCAINNKLDTTQPQSPKLVGKHKQKDNNENKLGNTDFKTEKNY